MHASDSQQALLRALPSVDALVRAADPTRLFAAEFVSDYARDLLTRTRTAIRAGATPDVAHLADDLQADLRRLLEPYPRHVINGTGVIVQTNLGRAPVSRATAAAMAAAAQHYVALEMRLDSGERGGRAAVVEQLLCRLTGAEAALVVNNNASAILLTLTALTAGREVLLSRGEAVEIGGGFRVPDVLRASGATLVDVGTTNRTYARDYAAAASSATAALLRVHASNYVVQGFTHQPTLAELRAVASAAGVLLIEDVGSGCLVDTSAYGLLPEPRLGDSIAAGVDVVTASGDKLLGGPQAGIVLGRRDVVDMLRRHPLYRAMRADKTCLAGLHTTLLHYAQDRAEAEIPVWWSVSRPREWVRERAEAWVAALGGAARVVLSESAIGGGSLPTQMLPSFALELTTDHPQRLARALRTGAQPVVPRVAADAVLIDGRTVLADEDDALLGAVRSALAG